MDKDSLNTLDISPNMRCRLCGNKTISVITIEDVLRNKILTLFQLEIGGVKDDLSRFICLICSEFVESVWSFLEKVHRVQEEFLEYQANSVLKNKNNVLNDLENLCSKQKYQNDFHTQFESDAIKNKSPILVTKQHDKSNIAAVVAPRSNKGWNGYPWACYICGQSVLNYVELKEHFLKEHKKLYSVCRMVCADCPKTYTKYDLFISHVKIHRPYLEFCCDICNQWYPTRTDCMKHRKTHLDNYKCNICNRQFKTSSNLHSHQKRHISTQEKYIFLCTQCPKKFSTKNNLIMHQKIHSGRKDFSCHDCGKSFAQKGNLEAHIVMHSPERPFKCSVCNRTFKTTIRLRKHLTVHTNLKPHVCSYCNKQFREKGTLKEHLRIHTGDMPYSCEFCGKTFRFKGILTTHRRTHTGERPYSCMECQHHFTNWPNYNKHMKRRHGIDTSQTSKNKLQSNAAPSSDKRKILKKTLDEVRNDTNVATSGTVLARTWVVPQPNTQHLGVQQFYVQPINLYSITTE